MLKNLCEKRSTNPPATMVTTIASNLWRSKKIPRMPNNKATADEYIISNLPKVARGVPHPGRSAIKAIIVALIIPSKIAPIFPKRITGSFKRMSEQFLTSQLIVPKVMHPVRPSHRMRPTCPCPRAVYVVVSMPL